jgi:hypothetical protein
MSRAAIRLGESQVVGLYLNSRACDKDLMVEQLGRCGTHCD